MSVWRVGWVSIDLVSHGEWCQLHFVMMIRVQPDRAHSTMRHAKPVRWMEMKLYRMMGARASGWCHPQVTSHSIPTLTVTAFDSLTLAHTPSVTFDLGQLPDRCACFAPFSLPLTPTPAQSSRPELRIVSLVYVGYTISLLELGNCGSKLWLCWRRSVGCWLLVLGSWVNARQRERQRTD